MSYIVLDTISQDDPKWHTTRSRGIGGSDAGVIMGLSKWSSPRSIYNKKLGLDGNKEPDESSQQRMHFGHMLEPIVRNEFCSRTGYTVQTDDNILQSVEWPWMLANIDGWVYKDDKLCGIFEAKTAGAMYAKDWDSAKVPETYYCQVQHYLAVTGLQDAWIAALIGGNQFFYYGLSRNDEYIEQLVEAERVFWYEHVLKGIPPGMTAEDEVDIDAKPDAPPITATSELIDVVEELVDVKLILKKAEKEKKRLENIIKESMGESTRCFSPTFTVTWKPQKRTTFDTIAFRQEHPEQYFQYSKTNEFRILRIKSVDLENNEEDDDDD